MLRMSGLGQWEEVGKNKIKNNCLGNFKHQNVLFHPSVCSLHVHIAILHTIVCMTNMKKLIYVWPHPQMSIF